MASAHELQIVAGPYTVKTRGHKYLAMSAIGLASGHSNHAHVTPDRALAPRACHVEDQTSAYLSRTRYRRASAPISAAIRAIVCTILLLASLSATAQTEVFTVAGEPVTHVPDGVTVIELDKPSRLDKQLSEGLPDNKAAAAKAVQRRLPSLKQAYGQAYRGLISAWRLGIKRVPAVVVNGRYVVYGQPDVAAAVAEIRHANAYGENNP